MLANLLSAVPTWVWCLLVLFGGSGCVVLYEVLFHSPLRDDWESSADERHRGYTVGPFTTPVGKEPGDLSPQQALEVLGRTWPGEARETADERAYGARERP